MGRVRSTAIALALSGLTVAGCAAIPGLGPGPLDTYQLTVPPPPAAGQRFSRRQILVTEPSAIKALDGENIVIKPAPGEIQFLSGAQWADRLPRIVQAKLVEAFQLTGRIGGVGMPGEGLAIDYQVIADIRSFEIRVDGGERAEIEIYVRVLNDRNGVVRAARSFVATAPARGVENDDFVAALNAAFGEVSTDIVNWTLQAI